MGICISRRFLDLRQLNRNCVGVWELNSQIRSATQEDKSQLSSVRNPLFHVTSYPVVSMEKIGVFPSGAQSGTVGLLRRRPSLSGQSLKYGPTGSRSILMVAQLIFPLPASAAPGAPAFGAAPR
jgi:hypothetical protein